MGEVLEVNYSFCVSLIDVEFCFRVRRVKYFSEEVRVVIRKYGRTKSKQLTTEFVILQHRLLTSFLI